MALDVIEEVEQFVRIDLDGRLWAKTPGPWSAHHLLLRRTLGARRNFLTSLYQKSYQKYTRILKPQREKMERVWYYIVSKSGADRAQWLDLFEKRGLDLSDELAPVYCDTKPRKPHGGVITIEQLPDLREALRSAGPGECLTIPHFGHLVSPAVWEALAGEIAGKGVVLDSIADEVVLDGTDLEIGKRLLKSRGARALTDARRRTRVKMGRPKKTLTGKRLEEAVKLFPLPEWTSGALAEKFGMGRMTFLRRIEDATGTMSKERAQEEAAKGNWPPKRKLAR